VQKSIESGKRCLDPLHLIAKHSPRRLESVAVGDVGFDEILPETQRRIQAPTNGAQNPSIKARQL